MNRRNFLSRLSVALGAVLGGVLAVPILGYILAPAFRRPERRWQPLIALQDLEGGSGPQRVDFAVQRMDGWIRTRAFQTVYVMRQQDGEFVVFSSTCTHLGCGVHWDEKQQQFQCPCHGGAFDATGRVIAGPPPRPLDVLPSRIDQGHLMVEIT